MEPSGKHALIPGCPARQVDATGAGDTFNGGFLSAWCRTGDWNCSGRYGAALASLCIEAFGFEGVAGRSREEVERLAKEVPVEEWKF